VRFSLALAALAACSKFNDKPADKPAYKAPIEYAKIDQALIQFCVKNHFKMVNCADDAPFWEQIASRYFAKLGEKVDDDERKHWIAVYKDDLIVLYRDRAFEKDCETTLSHTKAPSAHSISTVNAAREKSCAEFAVAFGDMLFVEGAFFDPR
jgi:hypothetical protein